jgi:hypothetical protein
MRAFALGSGFSRSFGIPTLPKLFDEIMNPHWIDSCPPNAEEQADQALTNICVDIE